MAWEKTYSTKVNGTMEDVWSLWSDVHNWKRWDSGIVNSSISGPFEEGTAGELKPVKGPKAKWILSKVDKGREFINEASLPLGKVSFIHRLDDCESGKITVTHSIRITGLSTFLFKKVIGKEAEKDIPNALQNIKRLIEIK